MAKRNNKTSHVLNILTRPPDLEEEVPQRASVDASALSLQETAAAQYAPPAARNAPDHFSPNATPSAISSSPAPTPTSTLEAASEKIKENLEKEVNHFLQSSAHSTNYSVTAETEEIQLKEQKQKYDYFFINILEEIVEEKVPIVLKQSNACTCNRCVNDAIALALNQLPPKYVATTQGGLFVQVTLYEKQHSVDILWAVTQACMQVAANPSHK